MNTKALLSLSIAAALVAGIATGFAANRHWNAVTSAPTPVSAQAPRTPLFYRNPMNPDVTSKVPAKDEMGMDYIPVYADDTHEAPGTVTIDPVTIQSIGVRTAQAERRPLSHVVRAPGRVDYDEATLSRLHPRVDGWVEALVKDKTGDRVHKGDVLLRLYSPNLVASEEEYLLTLSQLDAARASGDRSALHDARELAAAARDRLRLLDVPEPAIRALETTRKTERTLDLTSPFDGTITRIGVRQGQYVTPATELFTIADLSRVWVTVDVYEQDLPWIEVGDAAYMQVMAAPGRIWRGNIDYVYPYMQDKTRTVKVRLEFANADRLLRPHMFINVDIKTHTKSDAIVVPSEAVLRSGLNARVFVARPGGKFEPRIVTTGVASRGLTQILAGIAAGEKVVTSAQFLIDSESKLSEATAAMQEASHD